VIAASLPVQRPADARLLVVDGRGAQREIPRRDFPSLLRRGDLVVANDAATLPASLAGHHVGSGARIEVRLAAARSLAMTDDPRFVAIVFGAGDFRTRTEDRPLPPALAVGDRLALGPLVATVERLLDHRRLVELRFAGSSEDVLAAIAHHGRPIQYAHVPTPLASWDVWTPIAAAPFAFEAPSAGFTLDWRSLAQLRERGAGFATITLAAGISSTGDPQLDARLPFDEPYRIAEATAAAIRRSRSHGGRVIAIGTTVVRALESAAERDGAVHAGDGVATLRVGPDTTLRVVDAILSGTHERGTSHFELLRAFADDAMLDRVNDTLERGHFRTHEFGDSIFVDKMTEMVRGTIFHGSRSGARAA
jgi:S-adenosylmethionine:tRNA ribosyltransferase-isomerase